MWTLIPKKKQVHINIYCNFTWAILTIMLKNTFNHLPHEANMFLEFVNFGWHNRLGASYHLWHNMTFRSAKLYIALFFFLFFILLFQLFIIIKLMERIEWLPLYPSNSPYIHNRCRGWNVKFLQTIRPSEILSALHYHFIRFIYTYERVFIFCYVLTKADHSYEDKMTRYIWSM